MVDALPVRSVPKWLLDAAETAEYSLPLPQLLEDSLYYPASGLNGTPVKFLGGNVHSFIYADYGVSITGLLKHMYGTDAHSGFLGYELVKHRKVLYSELFPDEWKPGLAPAERELRLGLSSEPMYPNELSGHWSIWRRRSDFTDEHGPELFSFFYICAEMSKVYQALYTRYGKKPYVLAVIQPGSFGGEWERTENEDSMFKRVLDANPAGLPDYLLYGGYGGDWYNVPCWTAYNGPRMIQLPERRAGLWRLASARNGIAGCKNA